MISKIKGLGIWSIILIGMDAIMTFIGVGLLGKTELNPINYFFFGNVIISVLITHLIVMFIVFKLIEKAINGWKTKDVLLAFKIIIIGYSLVLINNIYHIIKEVMLKLL